MRLAIDSYRALAEPAGLSEDVTLHEAAPLRAFGAWLENARGAARPQRPEQELLAEHHLMQAVLGAMEEESRRLLGGQPLRPEFWRGAVEFIGNFSHRVHRLKEEQILFPALEAWGLLEAEACERLRDDHEALKDLTWLLCDGVHDGEWEKVFRSVATYTGRMRVHLEAEEGGLLAPGLANVGAERMDPLSDGFARLEAETLGAGGRLRFLEISRSLCLDVGIALPEAGLAERAPSGLGPTLRVH